jgi:hypothetical protein
MVYEEFGLQRQPEPRPSGGSKKRHSRTYSSNAASGGRASMSFMEESKDLPFKKEEVDEEPFIANNMEKVFE